MESKRYFIYLSYNGTNYCGWQSQPNGATVQHTLEEALSTVLRVATPIVGAGRTDAGVHARLMVAHFDALLPCPPQPFVERLNRLLPHDIAIHHIQAVRADAHARFDALWRMYHYDVVFKKEVFLDSVTLRLPYRLDAERMNQAAQTLFDYTDFTSFSKLHTDVKTNNCKIMKAEWIATDWGLRFEVQADRFLRNMVRAIVGTMIEVGRGKMTVDEFRQVIEQKDRGKAGTSVPGKALFLVGVGYDEALFIRETD